MQATDGAVDAQRLGALDVLGPFREEQLGVGRAARDCCTALLELGDQFEQHGCHLLGWSDQSVGLVGIGADKQKSRGSRISGSAARSAAGLVGLDRWVPSIGARE